MRILLRLFTVFCIITLGVIGARIVTNRYINEQIAGFRALLTASREPNVTTPTSGPSKTIDYREKRYAYDFFIVRPSDGLILLSNTQLQKTSETIMSDNDCRFGINGGFYDTDHKPIGLLVADGNQISPVGGNTLLNGFIYESTDASRHITETQPVNNVRLALQTGPMLISGGIIRTLRLLSDEYARRSVTATRTDGSLMFLTVFTPDSIFNGPLLADLPSITDRIAKREGFEASDAINLDGGSAAAFYSPEDRLPETALVGSFFCVK